MRPNKTLMEVRKIQERQFIYQWVAWRVKGEGSHRKGWEIGQLDWDVTAEYGGWTGSGESGSGSQTPWSVCTCHSDGHTPWCTGIHGNQGTDSRQICQGRPKHKWDNISLHSKATV